MKVYIYTEYIYYADFFRFASLLVDFPRCVGFRIIISPLHFLRMTKEAAKEIGWCLLQAIG